jgi:hypothetical protein
MPNVFSCPTFPVLQRFGHAASAEEDEEEEEQRDVSLSIEYNLSSMGTILKASVLQSRGSTCFAAGAPPTAL